MTASYFAAACHLINLDPAELIDRAIAARARMARDEAAAILADAGLTDRIDAERRRHGLDPAALPGDRKLTPDAVDPSIVVRKRRKS